jgi:hypothetical protein
VPSQTLSRRLPFAVRSTYPVTGEQFVTKDELRAELERQAKRYKDVYGGEVVTYAAQPDPDRKPWRKKPSLLDQAFEKELEKIEKEQQDKKDAS